MANESYVQVAPDSTGKKIRNLSAYVQQSDGSVSLVQMQVVALADEQGNPVDLDFSNSLQELVKIGCQQRFLLRMLLNYSTNLNLTDQDLKDVSSIV